MATCNEDHRITRVVRPLLLLYSNKLNYCRCCYEAVCEFPYCKHDLSCAPTTSKHQTKLQRKCLGTTQPANDKRKNHHAGSVVSKLSHSGRRCCRCRRWHKLVMLRDTRDDCGQHETTCFAGVSRCSLQFTSPAKPKLCSQCCTYHAGPCLQLCTTNRARPCLQVCTALHLLCWCQPLLFGKRYQLKQQEIAAPIEGGKKARKTFIL